MPWGPWHWPRAAAVPPVGQRRFGTLFHVWRWGLPACPTPQAPRPVQAPTHLLPSWVGSFRRNVIGVRELGELVHLLGHCTHGIRAGGFRVRVAGSWCISLGTAARRQRRRGQRAWQVQQGPALLAPGALRQRFDCEMETVEPGLQRLPAGTSGKGRIPWPSPVGHPPRAVVVAYSNGRLHTSQEAPHMSSAAEAAAAQVLCPRRAQRQRVRRPEAHGATGAWGQRPLCGPFATCCSCLHPLHTARPGGDPPGQWRCGWVAWSYPWYGM